MKQEELELLTNKLSQQFFGKPFVDSVQFNNRLRTTGGRYIPAKRTIEINPKYYKELGEEDLMGIIKHELCHYHLHIEGKPYHHRSREFRALLEETGSPRFCGTLPSEEDKKKHQFQCRSCGLTFKRKRKINPARYRCGKCQGKIVQIQ
ncbi:SprT family protein [Alkalibacillus silvisoli]